MNEVEAVIEKKLNKLQKEFENLQDKLAISKPEAHDHILKLLLSKANEIRDYLQLLEAVKPVQRSGKI